MIGGIVFLVGVVGLLLFPGVLMFEAHRGTRFFDTGRARLDRITRRAYRMLVFGEIPHTYRFYLVRTFRLVTHRVIVGAVSLLRALERPLSRMSHRMRRSNEVTLRAPSPFLQTISPKTNKNHKETGDV